MSDGPVDALGDADCAAVWRPRRRCRKHLASDLMARAPAKLGETAMSDLALEACMRRAQELDRTGTAIDHEIAAIDREAAEALLLERRFNAELLMLGAYDEPALKDFQRRGIRHE